MSEASYQGGCLCGALRYQAAGPVEQLCFCHCASCRRSAGATPVAWGTVVAARFRVTRGALASVRSSPPVVRSFCAACGTLLTYTHASRPGHVDFTLASLDEPAALKPVRHIWVSDRSAAAAPQQPPRKRRPCAKRSTPKEARRRLKPR